MKNSIELIATLKANLENVELTVQDIELQLVGLRTIQKEMEDTLKQLETAVTHKIEDQGESQPKGEAQWIRYRFKTYAEDERPLIFRANQPWWATGSGEDCFGDEYTIIVAFLPVGDVLEQYWNDAFDIELEPCVSITFTDRFPKPDWYTPTL